LVAGKYDDSLSALLETYFGDTGLTFRNEEPVHVVQPNDEKKHLVAKHDVIQSALRIGKQVANRENRDFHGLTVLSTILGGYFGSRLMANIREDKGYTYGIGCSIVTFPHAAYFNVTTEVGATVCANAITEIYSEIQRLIDEPIGDEELEVVRNYLLGDMLRNFDGVFALSNSLKALIESGLDYSHYEQYLTEIRTITPTRLQQLAAKWLQPADMYEVVAGKR
jgi:predicted Zn-dependent peptidase